MKTILLTIIAFTSLNTFAAPKVKTCPSNFAISLTSVNMTAGLSLVNQTRTKCEYIGLDKNNSNIDAVISFGTRKGQTSKATLIVKFFAEDIISITKLKSVSATKIILDSKRNRGVIKTIPTKIIKSGQTVATSNLLVN